MKRWCVNGIWGCCMAWALAAPAQAADAPLSTPSTQQLIEQLQKPHTPRTRGFRNLMVAPTPAGATSGAAAAGQVAVNGASGASGAQAAPPAVSLLIQFDYDSARVRQDSEAALQNLAQALLSPTLKAAHFAIEGHTDAQGSAAYNLRLSSQRALAVRDYLVALGVNADRLAAQGKGFAELAVPEQPHSPLNRRVRIVNLD